QADGERIRLSLRRRLLRHHLAACAVPHHAEARRAMSEAETFDPAALWFVGVVVALVVLFAAGIRLHIPPAGPARWLARGAIVGGAVAITILANMALYRHDAQLDVTREKAFTPS